MNQSLWSLPRTDSIQSLPVMWSGTLNDIVNSTAELLMAGQMEIYPVNWALSIAWPLSFYLFIYFCIKLVRRSVDGAGGALIFPSSSFKRCSEILFDSFESQFYIDFLCNGSFSSLIFFFAFPFIIFCLLLVLGSPRPFHSVYQWNAVRGRWIIQLEYRFISGVFSFSYSRQETRLKWGIDNPTRSCSGDIRISHGLLWNCSETALKLLWNCSEIASKLLWNFC